MISDSDIESVILEYWSAEVRNRKGKTEGDRVINMESACNRFKANLGYYLFLGSLKDLATRRSDVLLAVLNRGHRISERVISSLAHNNPELFTGNPKRSVTLMFYDLNHNFKGDLMTILSDPGMETMFDD